MATRKSKNYNPKVKNPAYSAIVAELLDALEDGNIAWRKPWDYAGHVSALHNPISDKPFTGRNVFILAWIMAIRGYTSPYFATKKQIKKAGGTVTDDKAGIAVVRYAEIRETKKQAAARLEVSINSIKWQDRRVKFTKPAYFTVYNIAECVEGIDIPDTTIEAETSAFEPLEACERIVAGYTNKPEIVTGHDGRAWYSSHADKISMPPKGAFVAVPEYYSTLLHELIHSTGHETRLERQLGNGKATKAYAVEELIAEIGNAILCGQAGIAVHTLENSAAYIQSWLQGLRNNPDILFDAIDGAIEAVDYILGQEESETETTPA